MVPKESHHSSEVACDLAAPSQALENCRECKELKKSVERTVPGLSNSRMVTRFLIKQGPRSQNWVNRSYVKINVLYFLYEEELKEGEQLEGENVKGGEEKKELLEGSCKCADKSRNQGE